MDNIELVVYKRVKDDNFDVFVNDADAYYSYVSAIFKSETTLKEIFEFGKKTLDKSCSLCYNSAGRARLLLIERALKFYYNTLPHICQEEN